MLIECKESIILEAVNKENSLDALIFTQAYHPFYNHKSVTSTSIAMYERLTRSEVVMMFLVNARAFMTSLRQTLEPALSELVD